MITILNTKTNKTDFTLYSNVHPNIGENLVIHNGDESKCYKITNIVNEYFIDSIKIEDINIILYGYPVIMKDE